MKLKTYNSELISPPKHDVKISDFIYDREINLKLVDKPETDDCEFKFVGEDNQTYFICQKNDAHRVVYYNNTPLFNFREKLFNAKTKIYKGKDKEEKIAEISPKNSSVAIKFSVEFTNQATGTTEVIDMNCDEFYGSCGIFQGKEKEGSPMIAKFVEYMDANSFLTDTETTYSVAIAPKVDNILIIALAVFYAKMNSLSREKRNQFH